MDKRKGYFLIIPAIIIMFIFTFYPLMDGIRVSFTDKSMLRTEYSYIGLDNYKQMLGDPIFWLSLRHSIILTGVVVILQLIFGLILAWTMKQEIPGMPIFKSLIMVSWVIPVAATVTIFKFMAQSDVGFINIILKSIGLKSLVRYWFGDPLTAFPLIILLHLWRNVPFYGIAFLAAMQTIPASFYEVAEINGANAFQSFWYITLPGIRNMIIVMVTIHVLWTFNNFDFIYLATGGGPINSTDVLPVYVYRQSWDRYAAGYGASIGTVMLLILSIYLIIYLLIQERGEYKR
ncbi:ABC transporter permease [Candidatus Atribacteria bacterium RBG_19FT_COMBO_35_14]|uniref:ABC transporter permease n=1 Tax=Candidatus Sediminicultor quintus TaxID=1797291 RepID=A0A1F5A4B8_9BACT|nr:MAG: ABC transporter permease [Candidatus Atribacteria bacterium RBG_19FT_COMBO_35_14]